MVLLSQRCMTTRKAIALTRWAVVGKVMFCFLIYFLKLKVKVKSLSHVRLFATPWTVAYQVPPSMGFSRQEYWSGFPFRCRVTVYSMLFLLLEV